MRGAFPELPTGPLSRAVSTVPANQRELVAWKLIAGLGVTVQLTAA